MSGWLARDNMLILLLMCSGYWGAWAFFSGSRRGFYLSILIALVGSCAEMLLIALGAFYYTKPQLFGLPYWTPALYALASLCLTPYIFQLRKMNLR